MKSQHQESFPVAPGAQPGSQPGQPVDGETSRIGAAINRILLISRATAQPAPPKVAAAGGETGSRSSDPAARRDATPVEWALRMMF
jgi:hypothetical protein